MADLLVHQKVSALGVRPKPHNLDLLSRHRGDDASNRLQNVAAYMRTHLIGRSVNPPHGWQDTIAQVGQEGKGKLKL
jgi:hypothetical protein